MDEFLSLPISARVAVGPASLDCKLCKENLQSAVVAPPSRGSVVVSRRPSQSGIITRPGTVGSFSAVRRRRGSLPMAYVEQEVSKECGEVVREISHASAATRDSVIRQLQALTYFRAKANGDLIAARRVEAVDGERLLTDGVVALSAVECPVHAARYSAVYKSSYPSLYNPSLNRRESANGRARLPGNPFASHRNMPMKPAHSRYMAPLPVTNLRRRMHSEQPDKPQGCPYCDAEAHELGHECDVHDTQTVHVPWLWGSHVDWNRSKEQWLLDYKEWKAADSALLAGTVGPTLNPAQPNPPSLDDSSSDSDRDPTQGQGQASLLYGIAPPMGVQWEYRKFGTADPSQLPVGILPSPRRPRGRSSRHKRAKRSPRPRGVHLFGGIAVTRSDDTVTHDRVSPPRAIRPSVSVGTVGSAETKVSGTTGEVLGPVVSPTPSEIPSPERVGFADGGDSHAHTRPALAFSPERQIDAGSNYLQRVMSLEQRRAQRMLAAITQAKLAVEAHGKTTKRLSPVNSTAPAMSAVPRKALLRISPPPLVNLPHTLSSVTAEAPCVDEGFRESVASVVDGGDSVFAVSSCESGDEGSRRTDFASVTTELDEPPPRIQEPLTSFRVSTMPHDTDSDGVSPSIAASVASREDSSPDGDDAVEPLYVSKRREYDPFSGVVGSSRAATSILVRRATIQGLKSSVSPQDSSSGRSLAVEVVSGTGNLTPTAWSPNATFGSSVHRPAMLPSPLRSPMRVLTITVEHNVSTVTEPLPASSTPKSNVSGSGFASESPTLRRQAGEDPQQQSMESCKVERASSRVRFDDTPQVLTTPRSPARTPRSTTGGVLKSFSSVAVGNKASSPSIQSMGFESTGATDAELGPAVLPALHDQLQLPPQHSVASSASRASTVASTVSVSSHEDVQPRQNDSGSGARDTSVTSEVSEGPPMLISTTAVSATNLTPWQAARRIRSDESTESMERLRESAEASHDLAAAVTVTKFGQQTGSPVGMSTNRPRTTDVLHKPSPKPSPQSSPKLGASQAVAVPPHAPLQSDHPVKTKKKLHGVKAAVTFTEDISASPKPSAASRQAIREAKLAMLTQLMETGVAPLPKPTAEPSSSHGSPAKRVGILIPQHVVTHSVTENATTTPAKRTSIGFSASQLSKLEVVFGRLKLGHEQRLYILEKYRRDPFVNIAPQAIKAWQQVSKIVATREHLLSELASMLTAHGVKRAAALQALLTAEAAILNDVDPATAIFDAHDRDFVINSRHNTVVSHLVRIAAATLAAVECCSKLLQSFGDVVTLQQRVYLEKVQVDYVETTQACEDRSGQYPSLRPRDDARVTLSHFEPLFPPIPIKSSHRGASVPTRVGTKPSQAIQNTGASPRTVDLSAVPAPASEMTDSVCTVVDKVPERQAVDFYASDDIWRVDEDVLGDATAPPQDTVPPGGETVSVAAYNQHEDSIRRYDAARFREASFFPSAQAAAAAMAMIDKLMGVEWVNRSSIVEVAAVMNAASQAADHVVQVLNEPSQTHEGLPSPQHKPRVPAPPSQRNALLRSVIGAADGDGSNSATGKNPRRRRFRHARGVGLGARLEAAEYAATGWDPYQ